MTDASEATVPGQQSETNAHAYLLLEPIGEGRNGTVWRGWRRSSTGLDRPVAIKLVDADRPVDDVLEGIADDAGLLARFRHRAVAGFEDALVLGGRPAVVSELIEGADLAALMGSGALSPRATTELLLEACAALEAAHAGLPDARGRPRPLLHLNLKPGNVRVTRWGEVKLTDFVLGQGASALYRSGNHGYTAPEAWVGGVGAPADLYALGVLGWECRSARSFGPAARSQDALNQQVADAFDAMWGDPLTPLLRRLLAWEPGVRPTASQARRELMDLLRAQNGPSLRDHLDHRLGGRAEPEVGRTGVFRMVSTAEPGPGIDPNAQTSILMVGVPDPSEVGDDGLDPVGAAPRPSSEGGWVTLLALGLVMTAGFLLAVCVALGAMLWVTR